MGNNDIYNLDMEQETYKNGLSDEDRIGIDALKNMDI